MCSSVVCSRIIHEKCKKKNLAPLKRFVAAIRVLGQVFDECISTELTNEPQSSKYIALLERKMRTEQLNEQFFVNNRSLA